MIIIRISEQENEKYKIKNIEHFKHFYTQQTIFSIVYCFLIKVRLNNSNDQSIILSVRVIFLSVSFHLEFGENLNCLHAVSHCISRSCSLGH